MGALGVLVFMLTAAAPMQHAKAPVSGPAVREEDVLKIVRAHFEQSGRTTPSDEPALSRAALTLAKKAIDTSAEEAAGLLSVTDAVSRQGGWDPSPLALFIKAPADGLLKAVQDQQWADEPLDVMGVGLAIEGRQASLCVLLSKRRLELKPFARSHKKPVEKPQRLCAALRAPLTTATIYVTRPRGDVDEVPMKAGHDEHCGNVTFPQMGRSAVEVLARGPSGPEVAALFFVDVGLTNAEDERVFVEPATAAKARSEISSRINSLRLSQRVPALGSDAALDTIAQSYAQRMASENFFAHIAPDGSDLKGRLTKGGYLYTSAGENLGSSSGSLAAHFGIEHSPGHRKNLLEPGFQMLGVGIAKRSDGVTVVVEVLATPLNDGGENPLAATYQAINQVRSRKKLTPLATSAVLEALAQAHAREALKQQTPKVELLGGEPLHSKVFKALDDVKSASVDVYVTESANVVPESKNLGDEKNQLVGAGMVRGDSEKFGSNKFWVVVIYAH